MQQRERVLRRQQGSYILTVEAGMSLLLSADAVAESSLQTELMEIQERWRHAHHRLDQRRRELQGLIKVRSSAYSKSFLTNQVFVFSQRYNFFLYLYVFILYLLFNHYFLSIALSISYQI